MNVARPRGSYCLKAAARCAPLAAAAGFAVATPLPTPPCGTPPVPAYASLGVQPAMAILGAEELDASVWRPSSCTGWPAASRSRVVVAVAGLVHVAGGPETLLARAGAVSTLRSMRYWSTTDKTWRPLFLDAAALAGPAEGGDRRGDFRPSELQAGRTLYFWCATAAPAPWCTGCGCWSTARNGWRWPRKMCRRSVRSDSHCFSRLRCRRWCSHSARRTTYGACIFSRASTGKPAVPLRAGTRPLRRTGRWHYSGTWPMSRPTRNHRPCDDLGRDATGPSSMRQSPAAALSRLSCSTRPRARCTVSHFPVLFVWVENCQ